MTSPRRTADDGSAAAGLAGSTTAAVPQIRLLGMPIARITRHEVVARVAGALHKGLGGWVITANVDYLERYVSDCGTAALYGASDLIVADGMPLLWAAWLRGTPLPDRVAGSDLVWLLAERAAADGRSLYLLGGAAGVAEGAAQRLREAWPALRIAGTSSPAISVEPTPEEIGELRARLREAKPDIVYVALGAPKEERLIAALRRSFPATWWIGVGISLSFIVAQVHRAPLWMQQSGLEWLHRLAQEPRRLARRYLLKNLPFTLSLLSKAIRGRYRGRPFE